MIVLGKIGHKSSECRWRVAYVDEEMQTGEKAEDNVNLKKIEKSEGFGSLGRWRRSRTKGRHASITHAVRWKTAPTARGAGPSAGQVNELCVTNSVKYLERTTRLVE